MLDHKLRYCNRANERLANLALKAWTLVIRGLCQGCNCKCHVRATSSGGQNKHVPYWSGGIRTERQNFQASVEVRLKRLISTAVEMRLKKSLVNRTCG